MTDIDDIRSRMHALTEQARWRAGGEPAQVEQHLDQIDLNDGRRYDDEAGAAGAAASVRR